MTSPGGKVRFGFVQHQSGWDLRREKWRWIKEVEMSARHWKKQGYSPDSSWQKALHDDGWKQASWSPSSSRAHSWPAAGNRGDSWSASSRGDAWSSWGSSGDGWSAQDSRGSSGDGWQSGSRGSSDDAWQSSDKAEWKKAGWWSPNDSQSSPNTGFKHAGSEEGQDDTTMQPETSMLQEDDSAGGISSLVESAAAQTEDWAAAAWEAAAHSEAIADASPGRLADLASLGGQYVVEHVDLASGPDMVPWSYDGIDHPSDHTPLGGASQRASARFGMGLVLPHSKKQRTDDLRPSLAAAFAAMPTAEQQQVAAANLQMMMQPDAADIPIEDSSGSDGELAGIPRAG